MRSEIKFYALVCMFAGLLRMLVSFIDYESAHEAIELVYILIDLGFILGLVGFYSLWRSKLNLLAHTGFVISLCGFAFIAGPESTLFGIGAYQIGTPVIGVGILLLSIALLRLKLLGVLAPLLLITSVIVGLASMLTGITLLFTLSGVLFGMGFVVFGGRLWAVQQ